MVNNSFLKNDFVKVVKYVGNEKIMRLKLKDSFKSEEVIVEKKEDKIIIRLPSLDDFKTTRIQKGVCRYIYLKNACNDVEIGVYKIDLEESNEDELVIYFEDKI